jgi:hypothetical protein
MSIMGDSKDIMHDFVFQEIRRLYSSFDGWAVSSQRQGSEYDTIFQADRLDGGHREIVRILATYKKEMPLSLIDALKTTGRMPDGMVSRYQFAVMAPKNADTSMVPAGIKVLTMQSFSFDGDTLTWIKKPVRTTDTPLKKSPAPQTA